MLSSKVIEFNQNTPTLVVNLDKREFIFDLLNYFINLQRSKIIPLSLLSYIFKYDPLLSESRANKSEKERSLYLISIIWPALYSNIRENLKKLISGPVTESLGHLFWLSTDID